MARLSVLLLGFFCIFNVYAEDLSLEQRILQLEQTVAELKQQVKQLEYKVASPTATTSQSAPPPSVSAENQAQMQSTPLQLQLSNWSYRETKIKFNTYYALDIALTNPFSLPITQVDARVKFSNQFGGHLYSVTLTPDLAIPSGATVVDEGTQANRRLLGRGHQMRQLKPSEINARLLVRKIVFADGSSLSF